MYYHYILMKVIIKKSPKLEKKLVAIFYDDDKKIKTTHFGAKGMSDFTQHADPIRKNRYLDRHRHRENWNDYMSAGALSRWILWNKTSLQASITDYKNKFNLK